MWHGHEKLASVQVISLIRTSLRSQTESLKSELHELFIFWDPDASGAFTCRRKTLHR